MHNGYFFYSDSDTGYKNVKWFDEYDIDLGRAIDPPPQNPWKQGVYMRRFEKGMAIVNPKDNGTQTISIPSGYRRIAGQQDSSVNNGEPAVDVTLPERDGIILIAETAASVAPPQAPSVSVE
jgi:hypothetical protein